jgi:hypothetical protein
MDFSTGSGESTPFKDLSNTINTGNNDDSSCLSASANAQQPTTSCILLGVVETSGGGEPTDAKERKRQRARERYAQMDKQKKDELLKKAS